MALITARTIVKDNVGVVKVGVKVYAQMIIPAVSGSTFDSTKKEIISIAGGIVDFSVEQGGTYLFWRGRSDSIRHRIPDDAVTPYTLPALIGNDSTDTCDT